MSIIGPFACREAALPLSLFLKTILCERARLFYVCITFLGILRQDSEAVSHQDTDQTQKYLLPKRVQ